MIDQAWLEVQSTRLNMIAEQLVRAMSVSGSEQGLVLEAASDNACDLAADLLSKADVAFSRAKQRRKPLNDEK